MGPMLPVLLTLAVVAAPACGRSSPESSSSPVVSPVATDQAPPATAAASAPGATAAPAPAPATSTPPAAATQQLAAAPGPMAVATKAIELRVEGVETVAQIGGRQARPDYEFVIVDTSWKNIIPLTAIDPKKGADRTYGAGGVGFAGAGSAGGTRAPSGDVKMEPTKYIVSALNRQSGC